MPKTPTRGATPDTQAVGTSEGEPMRIMGWNPRGRHFITFNFAKAIREVLTEPVVPGR
jgi:hypothetical protein